MVKATQRITKRGAEPGTKQPAQIISIAPSNFDAASGKIVGVRLALVGQCRDVALVNHHLMG